MIEEDVEWSDLLDTCLAMLGDCQTLGVRDPMKALTSIVSIRSTSELKKHLAICLAENLHYEYDDSDDIKAVETWCKILKEPVDRLPTLLGVREDLDELIADRLKE